MGDFVSVASASERSQPTYATYTHTHSVKAVYIVLSHINLFMVCDFVFSPIGFSSLRNFSCDRAHRHLWAHIYCVYMPIAHRHRPNFNQLTGRIMFECTCVLLRICLHQFGLAMTNGKLCSNSCRWTHYYCHRLCCECDSRKSVYGRLLLMYKLLSSGHYQIDCTMNNAFHSSEMTRWDEKNFEMTSKGNAQNHKIAAERKTTLNNFTFVSRIRCRRFAHVPFRRYIKLNSCAFHFFEMSRYKYCS